MSLRRAQSLLVLGCGFLLLLVVFNNLADYGSNLQFIRHVLSMDTTFPGNAGRWRALEGRGWDVLFYGTIIGWEALCCVIQVAGGLRLWRARTEAAEAAARRTATLGLTLSLMQWLIAFLAVGGEWFLMWQSRTWNGQEAAFRLFAVMGLCLIILHLPVRARPEPSARP